MSEIEDGRDWAGAVVGGPGQDVRAATRAAEALPDSVDVAGAGSPASIHDQPVLVSSELGDRREPAHAAVRRFVDVDEEVALETLVVEVPLRVDVEHGIAPEDTGLQHSGKRPGLPAVHRERPARRPEVRLHGVELPPADHHVHGVRGVGDDGR
jgi:hypothetical protein